jgi:hypothetical protein
MDMSRHDMNLHESLRDFRNDNEEYHKNYKEYVRKYALSKLQPKQAGLYTDGLG